MDSGKCSLLSLREPEQEVKICQLLEPVLGLLVLVLLSMMLEVLVVK